jgi:ribose transport system substrate-binding protein
MRTKPLRSVIPALLLVVGLGVAACSSSGGSSSSATSAASSSAPAASSTSAAASTPSASASSAGAVDYTALLQKAMQVQPSHYEGPTTPDKAPAGIKVASISCNQQLQGCVDLSAGVAQAAQAAGWQERTFDGQGSPTTQNTQILNAISWGAKVILLIAVDPAQVQIGLKAAKAAGDVIISCNNAGSSPNPTIPPVAGDVWPIGDVLQNQQEQGADEADWMIADSKGTANVLALNDNGFLSVKPDIDGFLNELKTCSGCTAAQVTFASADVGPALGQIVVGYLRTHPNVNYIFSPYDPAVPGIVTALHTAGMNTKIKLTAYLGNKENLQLVKNGDVQEADVSEDCNYVGWAMVDQAIRALDHLPAFTPWDENSPMQLLTAANLPSNISVSWDAPFNYRAEYTKLWK